MLYNKNGIVVYDSISDDFHKNMYLDYAFDADTNANYTVLRIYKNKIDGTKQYPFVRSPGLMSSLELSALENWQVIINAGIFIMETSGQPADGVVIQNGIVVNNLPATYHVGAMPLTIDADGNLSYAEADATGSALVSNGIVSAVCGFCPIITNYTPTSSFPTIEHITHFTQNAQRQIIGQWGNGDYAILTCEGRNFDHSDGWTLAEAQVICQKLGLKFAYNLDGGGSTQTVIYKKQINTIYEGTTGRKVPTFIVFNGGVSYAVPA